MWEEKKKYTERTDHIWVYIGDLDAGHKNEQCAHYFEIMT